MHDLRDPERQPPRPPRNKLQEHAEFPASDPAPGTWVMSQDLGLAGAVKGYYAPDSFLREGAEPDEQPVPSWCVELESGDVALWPGDWRVMTPHEQMVFMGALVGLGALFKGVLEKAKNSTSIKPAWALELIALALNTHLRVTTSAIEQARAATTQGLIGAKANGEKGSTRKGG